MRPARPSIVGTQPLRTLVGCRLIAEGIETEAELQVLRTLEIALAQGFLLGRPGSVADHRGNGKTLSPRA